MQGKGPQNGVFCPQTLACPAQLLGLGPERRRSCAGNQARAPCSFVRGATQLDRTPIIRFMEWNNLTELHTRLSLPTAI